MTCNRSDISHVILIIGCEVVQACDFKNKHFDVKMVYFMVSQSK